jgi:hypothetical protein
VCIELLEAEFVEVFPGNKTFPDVGNQKVQDRVFVQGRREDSDILVSEVMQIGKELA